MQNSQRGTFRVTLSMRKAPEGSPVYCKMEKNARFTQLKTVKLQSETTYRMDVSFKPPRDLESIRFPNPASLNGIFPDWRLLSGDNFSPFCIRFLTIDGKEIVAKERARDSTANAYSTYYSTKGLLPSKRGTRQVITITMKVQGSGELSTRIQVKVYKQSDIAHCEWGSKLHCIELDCSNNGANVIKETYRKIGVDD